jgi:hypothetical protein
MILIEKRGGFLWQHRPDVIPQGFVTDEEISLWGAFYEMRAREAKQRG